MGIDIYAQWKGQTKKEKDAQYTGFSIQSGNVGYLREAYHGEPYATHYFVSEAFSSGETTKIPALTLLERLPKTLELVRERQQRLYPKDNELSLWKAQKAYVDFYELCAKKEKETGEPCVIYASY